MFNPDSLLSEASSEVCDTKYVPIPVGEWQAVIDKIDLRQETSKKDGKSYVILDITWNITDPDVRAQLERDTITVRQSIFPDLTDDGKMDYSKGKNVPLGRIREALGLNSGQAFALSHLIGAGPAKVAIVHNPAKDGTDSIFANIKSVGRAI